MIVEFSDHDMGEQSRPGFAALDRQGRHLASYRRIAIPADHALFDMADNLNRRRHVLQHLDHPVGRLQERCATTGRADVDVPRHFTAASPSASFCFC